MRTSLSRSATPPGGATIGDAIATGRIAANDLPPSAASVGQRCDPIPSPRAQPTITDVLEVGP